MDEGLVIFARYSWWRGASRWMRHPPHVACQRCANVVPVPIVDDHWISLSVGRARCRRG